MNEPTPPLDHPAEPPDIESSSARYALRFAGAVGDWFLAVQLRLVLRLLGHGGVKTILEVGGGHAQLTTGLLGAGYRVVVQGSRIVCADLPRRDPTAPRVPFVCSALDRLPFPNRSFDAVVTIRMTAHVADPSAFLKECCRVAGRGLVIDYASNRSLNSLSGALFALKRRIEKDTRRYRSFDPSMIERIVRSEGFVAREAVGQYFWPMAAHRLHRRAGLARLLEFFPRVLGLTRRFGSPVLALYERQLNGS